MRLLIGKYKRSLKVAFGSRAGIFWLVAAPPALHAAAMDWPLREGCLDTDGKMLGLFILFD